MFVTHLIFEGSCRTIISNTMKYDEYVIIDNWISADIKSSVRYSNYIMSKMTSNKVNE